MANNQCYSPSNSAEENNFDYQQLNHQTRLQIQQLTTDIKNRLRHCAQDIVEIGNSLAQIKQQLQHGQFRTWLKTEFDWSVSTANKFMQVSQNFKLTDLEEIEIAPSALYILAAPSTPETLRLEAINQAKQGKRITHAIAQQLIKDNKIKSDEKDGLTVQVLSTEDSQKPLKIEANVSSPVKISQSHVDISSQMYSFSDFQDCLHREWRRMSREKHNLALIFCQISLENNQELTSLPAQIIQQVTDGFSEALKRPGDFAGLHSNNQWAAVLPRTDSEGAKCVAQRFLNWFMTWKQEINASNSRQGITINLGVTATSPDTDNSYNLLLKTAQLALSKAKNQGSNQIVTQDEYLKVMVSQ